MASRRVTDLAYGQLGEALYNPNSSEWSFTRDFSGFRVQQVLDLQLQLPAEDKNFKGDLSRDNIRPKQLRRSQEAWLWKKYPETAPAGSLTTLLAREAKDAEDYQSSSALSASNSSLFSVCLLSCASSPAHDVRELILVRPCGEARNELEFILPAVRQLSWEGHQNPTLEVLDFSELVNGHWLGSPGPIQQVEASAPLSQSGLHIAVRQGFQTTILGARIDRSRSRDPVESMNRDDSVIVNVVLGILPMTLTGGYKQIHVAFNPWNNQQLAVLDESGGWSVWDINSPTSSRTRRFHMKASGCISNGLEKAHFQSQETEVNEWGRCFWVADASVVLICTRRHIVAFDLNDLRLRIEFSHILKDEFRHRIIDVRRDPSRIDHFYVLTTTQVIWMRLVLSNDTAEWANRFEAQILLSCRHFRNGIDLTMQLELFTEDEACVALLFTPASLLINAFRFSMSSGKPSCSTSSVYVKDTLTDGFPRRIRNIHISPSAMLSEDEMLLSGPGKEYFRQDIRFYDMLVLCEDLSIFQTLLATSYLDGVSLSDPPEETILPPTILTKVHRDREDLHGFGDDLVITDDEQLLLSHESKRKSAYKNISITHGLQSRPRRRTQISRFEACMLYWSVFKPDDKEQFDGRDLVELIDMTVEQISKQGNQSPTTLFNLSNVESIPGDIDEIREALDLLAQRFNLLNYDEEGNGVENTGLTVSRVPSSLLPYTSYRDASDLSWVYDSLIDLFVTSLPRNTPGPIRLAKERLVRKAATELFLSSICLSFRDSCLLSNVLESAPVPRFELPIRGSTVQLPTSTSRPVARVANQGSPSHGLPTPRSSSRVSTSGKEPAQDGGESESAAVRRLRVYSPSIKSQSPLAASKAAILSHWPSTPGSDPELYSWSAVRHALSKQREGGEEEEENRKQARRRRRMERLSIRESQRDPEGSGWASQPIPRVSLSSQTVPKLTFGSQPDARLPTVASSSQVVEDVPMTQPVLGVFGSRDAKQGKNKKRKSKAIAGFR